MSGKEMNVYTVLLADDEEDVIQAIIRRIDWAGLGFRVLGHAHNGLEALEMAEEEQPDVVMTDIKMPYMDGLTLSHRLRDQFPAVKIIIFSGFDEFEYAKEAIRLEAEEYILKPINAEELSALFARIHDALDKERDEQQNIERLQQYYQESLPILQESFYSALIEGRVPADNIEEYAASYQISLPGPLYTIVVLHTSTSRLPQGMDPMLASISVRRLAGERLSSRWQGRLFSYLGNTVMIAQMPAPADISDLTDACDRFCRLAGQMLRLTVTAGIGTSARNVRELSLSYNGAREAVSYRAIYGAGRAINIDEITPNRDVSAPAEDGAGDLHELFKCIRLDDTRALEATVSAYIESGVRSNQTIRDYRFFVMGLVSALHQFAADHSIQTELAFGAEGDIYRSLQQMDTRELTGWITQVCLRLQALLREKRTDTSHSIVSRATEYVENHYREKELNIEHVCRYLGISAAYFSTLFKKETGKTFLNYLTDRRMQEAVQLLMKDDAKTYVIARQVGYEDPNYFSYVFKKKFGVSPSKYRRGDMG